MIHKAAAWALALWATALPAAASCRLALLLAMDVSNSVNAQEDALQREGLAAALLSKDVQNAAFANDQTVTIAAFEWSGRHHQQLMVDWTTIASPLDLQNMSARIASSKRGQTDFPTALGHALIFAQDMFETAPPCLFRTLDVAGDGKSNTGIDPADILRRAAFDDITVNGLVVRVLDLGLDFGVPAYYQAHVKHGAGAFVEVAEGFEDYERAITRKLVSELSPTVIGSTPIAETAG